MKQVRAVMEVARWEFLRYLKPKQQLVGMVITFAIGLGSVGVQRLAQRGDNDPITIAVIGAEALPVDSAAGRLRFVRYAAADEPRLLADFSSGTVAGLLRIRDADNAELLVKRRSQWTADVESALRAARQDIMMQRAGIGPDALAQISAAPALEIEYQQRTNQDPRGARLAATIIISLMLFAVFMGMSYIFTSITGEKQIRVTEQVVSAITPQSWIDGKILGLAGVSIVGVANTVIAVIALLVVLGRFNAVNLPLPATLGDPVTITVVAVFALLGLFFWFAFLGAVAATIDDPQTSTRGSLLMVPLFMTLLAFFIARNPDSGFARVISLLPPTSPSAMPARMMLTNVHPVEVMASLVLLAGGVLVLRTIAGRIFRLGMLMYGKEPTWQELRRWMFAR